MVDFLYMLVPPLCFTRENHSLVHVFQFVPILGFSRMLVPEEADGRWSLEMRVVYLGFHIMVWMTSHEHGVGSHSLTFDLI
jgi:hypothetical protein